jgi:hypothetical protein
MLPRSTLRQDDSTYELLITGNTARAYDRLSMFGEFGGPSNPGRDEPDPSDAAVTDSGTSSIGSSVAPCCPAMAAVGKGGSTPRARSGCCEVTSVLSGCSNPGLLDDCPFDGGPVSVLDWLISRSSIGSSIPGELGFGDLFESLVITFFYISHLAHMFNRKMALRKSSVKWLYWPTPDKRHRGYQRLTPLTKSRRFDVDSLLGAVV